MFVRKGVSIHVDAEFGFGLLLVTSSDVITYSYK